MLSTLVHTLATGWVQNHFCTDCACGHEPSELASNGYLYHIESWSWLRRQDYLFEIPSHYLLSCRVIKTSYKSEPRFASWAFYCSPSKLFWYYFSLLFIHDRDQLIGAEFVRVRQQGVWPWGRWDIAYFLSVIHFYIMGNKKLERKHAKKCAKMRRAFLRLVGACCVPICALYKIVKAFFVLYLNYWKHLHLTSSSSE